VVVVAVVESQGNYVGSSDGGLNQQWMAERVILVVDGRVDEVLNLRLTWKATDLAEEAELKVMFGD